ncbi:alpha/beta fold hydrolase [Thalassotalea marina]|uniref:Alpha/beta hydrolase n=1 Tax=Thalassotalea marina TaxID=1673741 RepID=A0A919BLP8_9GAMM|nr:alpha/beta fold hydrolase [Thalassotalea marina]GHG00106.1 hypothetical protein GCM10017161_30910 [Thalassotalea marina]
MNNSLLHNLTILAIVFFIVACQSDNTIIDDSAEQPSVTSPVNSSLKRIDLNNRYYHIASPANFNNDKAYKLLLVFHGSGGSGIGMSGVAQFEQLSQDYLVVYAKSQEVEWNEGCDCNIAHRKGIDDLAYVEQVISDIKNNYRILDGEIYGVGFSQGALFSQNLLCNKSSLFKALAAVAAPMSKPLSQTCQITTPTNYLAIHGTADSVLPFQGLQHSNWALISSPAAIELIASLNQLHSPATQTQLSDDVTVNLYKSDSVINQLVAIDGGRHTWNYSSFNTSQYILDFFQQVSDFQLPQHASLIQTSNGLRQIRTMGSENTGPAVVLLSGFNKNFHSDSAWYALLQPLLAQDYRVHVIDSAGLGFSPYNPNGSYQLLADDLYQILVSLNEREISLVAFASSNITAQLFQAKYADDANIKINNMVWIDPDILLPHSIAFYKGYPVDWYEKYIVDLQPHIEDHYFTERSTQKIADETKEVQAMVPTEFSQLMDWDYYHAMVKRRLTIAGQKARAMNIAKYPSDLDAVADIKINNSIPITVIDSDFEQAQIDSADENIDVMIRWQQEGTTWSKEIATKTNGQYIPLNQAKHLVVFEHPEVIKSAIDHYMQ